MYIFGIMIHEKQRKNIPGQSLRIQIVHIVFLGERTIIMKLPYVIGRRDERKEKKRKPFYCQTP